MTRTADGELHIDSVLRNTYKVVSVLGRGGMGSVFLAQHLRLPGKQVAVKVLRVGDHVGPDLHVRFRREAEIASRLGHPNIVEVLDFDTLEDGSPFLVLEYLRGESLADRLRRGRLTLEEVFSFTRQMGSALQTAHRAGIVHRDLKPANIYLVPTDSGGVVGERVKLLDFGISKVMSSETLQTQEAVLIGTPQYMSPEQAQGHNSRIDARTDLFALGGIVFEMLSGMTPFGGGSLAQIIYRVVHEPPVALTTLMPDLPPNVARAVARALEKSPDHRHPDVGAFVAELTGTALQSLPETEAQIAARTLSKGKRPSGVAMPSVVTDDDAMGATMAPANRGPQGPGTGRFGPGSLAGADDIGFDATMAPGTGGGTASYGQQASTGTMGFGATQLPGTGTSGPSGVALPAAQSTGLYGVQQPVQGYVAGPQQAGPGYATGQYGAPSNMGGHPSAQGSYGGQQPVTGQYGAPASMGVHPSIAGGIAGPQGAPGTHPGQQVPPGSYGGQQPVPGYGPGPHGAPQSYSGQQLVPGQQVAPHSYGGQQPVPGQHGAPVSYGGQQPVPGQHGAPISYGGQQPVPGYGTGQQVAPHSYGGQQPVPGYGPGPHGAPASYGGQQPVPGTHPGAVGPQGQAHAPMSMSGQPGMPGPQMYPVGAASAPQPKSRVPLIAGATALIIGAMGVGWWMRPPPPAAAPPPVSTAPTQPQTAQTAPPPVKPPPPEPPTPPTTVTQPQDTPPVVAAQTPPDDTGTKTKTHPSKKNPGVATPSARLARPTNADALRYLKDAESAFDRKDMDTALRLARRSYASQDNLAAHHVAVRSRCFLQDLGGFNTEAVKVHPAELKPLRVECQTKGIELPQ
jgi:hypothetical protein